MTALRPLAAIVLFLTVSLSWSVARATPIEALSAADAASYRTAFSAAERGDFTTSEAALRQVRDQSLLGEVRLIRLMHPTTTAHYDELASWLRMYADHMGADRVYALALRRGPADGLPRPLLLVDDAGSVDAATPTGGSGRSRAAREAYYNGDISRAYALASAAGERWIAGLAAYRLGQYAQATLWFSTVARNPAEDPWLRAAGGFWAARSAEAAGQGDAAPGYLRLAASFPTTFYGMIAARRLELSDDPLGHIVQASLTISAVSPADNPGAEALIRSDPRARRAAALMQIGRAQDAALELRAGLALAADDARKAQWTSLALTLNPVALGAAHAATLSSYESYPVPNLTPVGGFVLDRALVYGIIRQESRFNPLATSPAGARGLMQLMPATAAQTSGMDFLVRDPTTLFDPPTNLMIGQAYLSNLLQGDMGYDVLRALAAYNGGPGAVARTLSRLDADADSLMVIESLPYQETRNYVERVMANYWIYRHQFGQSAGTLDAMATGARYADIRLDRLTAAQDTQVAQTIAARQTLVSNPAGPALTQPRQPAAVAAPAEPSPGSLIQRPIYQQGLGAEAPTRQPTENTFR